MVVWEAGKKRRERVATRRARVRTDEDRSAWRFAKWDAEAVEKVGAGSRSSRSW